MVGLSKSSRTWVITGLLGFGALVTLVSIAIASSYAVETQILTTELSIANSDLQDLRAKLAHNGTYRDFSSLDELDGWVSRWGRYGKTTYAILFQGDNCVGIAEQMQRDGLLDGYLMSVALVDSRGTVYDVKVKDYTFAGVVIEDFRYHMGVLTNAGGIYYYVEAQTGAITKVIGRR